MGHTIPRTALASTLLALPVACQRGVAAPEVTVFAAASLRDVVTELGDAFEQRDGTEVVCNFAGSNFLAQQIAAAPRADVFVSAHTEWIDFLEREGRVLPGSRRALLANRLVVVGHARSVLEIDAPADLVGADFRYLAVANPEAVPAGRYARDWLASVPWAHGSVWDALAPRITPVLDVRAALALVESAPDVVGIVYASDVLGSERARVLFEPPVSDQPEILYAAVRLVRAGGGDASERFFRFLFSDEARAAYRRHGFEPLAP